MSRSNREEGNRNPAVRWFEWAGKEQKLKYWDKDKKENFFVEAPFTFLVLDQLATVTGWNNAQNATMFANEVRNTKVEPLSVKTRNGSVMTGLYEEIKANVPDAKYTRSIYIAFYDNDELKIGNIKLAGAARQEWADFAKENKVYDGAVTFVKAQKRKNKGVEFYVPVFKMKEEVSADTEAKAQELDQKLQKYLSDYFAETFIDPTELRLSKSYATPARQEDHVLQWGGPSKGGQQESPFAEAEDDDDEIPF